MFGYPDETLALVFDILHHKMIIRLAVWSREASSQHQSSSIPIDLDNASSLLEQLLDPSNVHPGMLLFYSMLVKSSLRGGIDSIDFVFCENRLLACPVNAHFGTGAVIQKNNESL